jgi:peptide/nickel transport system permease protein
VEPPEVAAEILYAPAAETSAGVRRARVPYVRDVRLVLCGGWLGVVLFAAIFGPLLPIDDPLALDPAASRVGPSAAHWLGGDQLGRDILSRLVDGARVSMLVGFGATSVAALIGGTAGLLAGFYRGKFETGVMACVDIMLSVPALILAITLTGFLGANLRNIIITIAILATPAFARVTRSKTLAVAERDFVRAARSLGASRRRIIVREVTPNVVPSVLAYSLVIVATAIVVEGSLSFLGLGVPPPQPSWGGMISEGTSDLTSSPYISLIPAAVMFLTILSLNLVGEEFQRRFDLKRGTR